MTDAQIAVLYALNGAPRTRKQMEKRCGYSPMVTQRVLDGLFRRSLVTLDGLGRWQISERGLAKLSVREQE